MKPARTSAHPLRAAAHRAAGPRMRGWAAAGVLVGAVLALLVFAPARWLAHAVAQASGGRVVLADARGTLWSGHARAVLSGGAGSRDAMALPGRVHWTLRPMLNFSAGAGARLALRADCCTDQPLRLQLQPRWGHGLLSVADGSSRWPSAWLTGLGTPWNTLQPDGLLQLSTRGLAVRWAQGRIDIDGQAEVLADAMSSRLSTLRPLGSYRLQLTGGPTPALTLQTLAGSLQLSGQGQWVGGRLRFEGLAQAEAQREDALGNLLNLIGQRRGAQSRITLG